MHGARRLVVTALLVVVAVTVVAGGTSAAPTVSGEWMGDAPRQASTSHAPAFSSDSVAAGRGLSAAARDDANATVRRQESDGNMTVIVAPGAALESMQTATSADEYGPNVALSARPRVTLSDTLVLRIQAPGLEDAVQAQSGNSTTRQFVSLLESDDAELLISQFGARDEIPRAIDTRDTSAMSVVPAGNNTYDVVIDLASIEATLDANGNNRADDDETVGVASGDTYRANFTFGETQIDNAFAVFPVAVIFLPDEAGNNPSLRPAPNQTIHARTTLAPGTVLGVEVTVDSADVFRHRQEVTVVNRSQSQFTAEFDLRDAPDGVDISVVVDNDDQVISATSGRVSELRASITLPQRADERDRVPVSNLSLSQGGFLIVRDGGPNGTIVANRYLTGGNYTDLSVLLSRGAETDTLVVTAYADLDTDRVFDATGPDRPFRVDGSLVRARIRLPGTTQTPAQTATTTATPTETETSSPTARRVTSPPTTTTTDPQTTRPFGDTTTEGFTPYTITATGAPGFGIGIALAAIVALVALLAGRQRRAE
jgi:hypothetical protein